MYLTDGKRKSIMINKVAEEDLLGYTDELWELLHYSDKRMIV